MYIHDNVYNTKGDEQVTTSYDQIYDTLLPKLAKCNLVESAARLGLEVKADGSIIIKFLKRDYHITHEGVIPVDGQPVNINNRSILVYYILSKGSGDPVYLFKPLFRMTGMYTSHNTERASIMDAPLIREFGNDFKRLEKSVIKLGGKSSTSNADLSWILELLPKIPVKILFYEEDDEFPADIQIHFDQRALDFLEFECLAFLSGCLVRALVKTSQYGTVDGWK